MAAIALSDAPAPLSAYVPIYDDPSAGSVQTDVTPDRGKYLSIEELTALFDASPVAPAGSGLRRFTPEDEQPLTMFATLDVASLAAPALQPSAVPEPGTIALVGAALAWGAMRTRRTARSRR